jgi:hypothetical protein
MKSLSATASLLMLAAILPAHAQSGKTYKEGAKPAANAAQDSRAAAKKMIYRIPGIRDSGDGGGVGVATVVNCTNFSTAAQNVKFILLDSDGKTAAQKTVSYGPNITQAVSTHTTNVFFDDYEIAPGKNIDQGAMIINSTSTDVFCTAAVVDANATASGIALHVVRYNAAPGTQE